MLSIADTRFDRHCQGRSRREFLRIGGLGLLGGRDHYANLTTLAFAGGGLKMGQVIGQSDRLAANPTSERYTPKHLMATVMQTVLDLGEVRVRGGLGKVAAVLTDGEPIPGLL